jgi:hypothetical protein
MEIVAQIAPVEMDSHGLIAFMCSGCGSADSILIDARAWRADDQKSESSPNPHPPLTSSPPHLPQQRSLSRFPCGRDDDDPRVPHHWP